ncbi:MAG: ABC transporter ATP-binding protein [Candidatus Hydrogenedentota bacterium]
MYGVDEKTNYDVRNAAKTRGPAWPIYRRLLGYMFDYKSRLALSVVFAMFVALSFGAIIVGAGQVVMYVFDNEAKVNAEVAKSQARFNAMAERMQDAVGWGPAGIGDQLPVLVAYLREDPMRSMLWLCALIVFLSLIGGLARYIQEYLCASIATFVTVRLGRELYANIIRLPLRFFEKRTSGEIIARMTNDTFAAGRGLTAVFMKIFREPFKALVFLAIAAVTNPFLTFIALGVLPPVGYVMVRIGQSVRKRMRRTLEKIAGLQTVAKESVVGITIIKGFSMEPYVESLVNREYKKLERQGLKMMRADAAIGPLTEFVMVLGFAVFILVSANMVIHERLLFSDLVKLYGALFGLLDPVRKLTSVNNAVQTSVASAERVFEFIDLKPDIVDLPGATDLPPIRESIRFEDVRFSYDGRTEVLRGVSFEVKKGEMVAIVGFSGAGKSTIVKLLPRFYDVSGGRICIDGVDIRSVTQSSLRAQISLVTQETILFDESVRSNIAAGNDSYSDERILQALKAAHADDFVQKLHEGLNTRIGEAGGRLSGGQRQRLAIARALIKDPTILILDEATSNLDSKSERAIQEAIEEFVVGRTTLVIAHRLSTVRRADRILVLDQGRIVDAGTHLQLMDKPDGIYRRLYESQFAVSESGPEIGGGAVVGVATQPADERADAVY